MRIRLAAPVLVAFALWACDADTVGPGATSLSFTVVADASIMQAVDAGTVRLEGPTPRTESIQPGETKTIEGLLPGPYTVSLEGFASGQLAVFGETNVTVVAGQNRNANLQPLSFVPASLNVPPEVEVGQPVNVQWAAVTGATGYRVEWATNPAFTGPQGVDVTGTSTTVNLTAEGDFHFRVRARNRFGSVGVPRVAGGPVRATPAAVPLADGVPVTNLSGAQGSQRFFTFNVPSGGSSRVLQVRIQGGSGDADLAIRRGSAPTLEQFDCASVAEPGEIAGYNLDFCSVLNPQAGTWHIMILGHTTYSGLSIDARMLATAPLQDGVPRTGLGGGVNDILYFVFAVPQAASSGPAAAALQRTISGSDVLGASKPGIRFERRRTALPPSGNGVRTLAASISLEISISGGSGDADLVAGPRTPVFSMDELPGWPCAGFLEGNVEECSVESPEAGPWTVLVIGFQAFSGVTLTGRMDAPEPLVLWNNGGFVTHPGAGAGGAHASMQSEDAQFVGHNVRHIAPNPHFRIADDFTVGEGGWVVQEIVTHAVELGSMDPPWTSFSMNIWRGRPGDAGSSLVSTTTAATWEFSGVYRVSRPAAGPLTGGSPIQAITWDFGSLELAAGEYWIDWQIGGGEATGANYVMEANPQSPDNPTTVSGNGRQLTATNTWNPMLVTETKSADIPFQVIGFPAGAAGGAAAAAAWPRSPVRPAESDAPRAAAPAEPVGAGAIPPPTRAPR